MIFDTKLLFALASLTGFAAATSPVPPKEPECFDGIICKDSISPCGERYGGCYNPCRDPEPKMPPCPSTMITSAPTTEPTPDEEDDCIKRIICIDAVNECGIPYGGCVPDCSPIELYTPPCPTSTFATVTGRATIF